MSLLTVVRHGQASFFADDYDKLSIIGELRLKVTTLNQKPWEYGVEILLPDGTWQNVATSGYVRMSLFKRRAETRYMAYPKLQPRLSFLG